MKTEKHTRQEIIDLRLKKPGWNVRDKTHVSEEFDIIVDQTLAREAQTPYSGHQYSDYDWVRTGSPLQSWRLKRPLWMQQLEGNRQKILQ